MCSSDSLEYGNIWADDQNDIAIAIECTRISYGIICILNANHSIRMLFPKREIEHQLKFLSLHFVCVCASILHRFEQVYACRWP